MLIYFDAKWYFVCRNGSIQCAFYLQLNGVANLTILEDEFSNCIGNLKTATVTVDGVNIDVDENAIKAEYLRGQTHFKVLNNPIKTSGSQTYWLLISSRLHIK